MIAIMTILLMIIVMLVGGDNDDDGIISVAAVSPSCQMMYIFSHQLTIIDVLSNQVRDD